MTRKIPAGKKNLSLIVPENVYAVISAVAQIHGLSMNEVAGDLLAQFAKKNSAAISAAEEMKKSAQENFPLQTELDFPKIKIAPPFGTLTD